VTFSLRARNKVRSNINFQKIKEKQSKNFRLEPRIKLIHSYVKFQKIAEKLSKNFSLKPVIKLILAMYSREQRKSVQNCFLRARDKAHSYVNFQKIAEKIQKFSINFGIYLDLKFFGCFTFYNSLNGLIRLLDQIMQSLV